MPSSNILVLCCSACLFLFELNVLPCTFPLPMCVHLSSNHKELLLISLFQYLHTLFDKLPLQNGPSGFGLHGNLSPVGTCWEKSIIMSPFTSWCEKAAEEARKRVRETHTRSSGKRVCLQSGSASTGGNALLCSL